MEFHGWKVAVNSCQQFAPLALYLSKFSNRREFSFWSTSVGKRPASLCRYGLRDAASRGQRPTVCDKLKLKGGVLQLHLQSIRKNHETEHLSATAVLPILPSTVEALHAPRVLAISVNPAPSVTATWSGRHRTFNAHRPLGEPPDRAASPRLFEPRPERLLFSSMQRAVGVGRRRSPCGV